MSITQIDVDSIQIARTLFLQFSTAVHFRTQLTNHHIGVRTNNKQTTFLVKYTKIMFMFFIRINGFMVVCTIINTTNGQRSKL